MRRAKPLAPVPGWVTPAPSRTRVSLPGPVQRLEADGLTRDTGGQLARPNGNVDSATKRAGRVVRAVGLPLGP